jgi:hypothetical protein
MEVRCWSQRGDLSTVAGVACDEPPAAVVKSDPHATRQMLQAVRGEAWQTG